jgi:hypothetical protein
MDVHGVEAASRLTTVGTLRNPVAQMVRNLVRHVMLDSSHYSRRRETPRPEPVDQFKELLDPDIRPPLHNRGMWLVRPDGYVACSAENVATIGAYLRAVCRPIA